MRFAIIIILLGIAILEALRGEAAGVLIFAILAIGGTIIDVAVELLLWIKDKLASGVRTVFRSRRRLARSASAILHLVQ